jgi:hypothetical protein
MDTNLAKNPGIDRKRVDKGTFDHLFVGVLP